jgi:hypothetical protein
MLGVPVLIMSAKTVQALLPMLLGGALAGALARQRLVPIRPLPTGTEYCLLAVIIYAGLSGLWAPQPAVSAAAVLMAALIAVGSLSLIALLRREGIEDALHMGEGLWIGLMAGMLYAVIEIASGQALKIWAYNSLGLGPDVLEPARYFTWKDGRVIAVHGDDLTRNIVPVPLLIWPSLMAAVALPARIWRPLVCATLIGLASVAVLFGTSETAKLALLAGLLTFAAARVSLRAARGALSVAWVAICLAIVPLALLAWHLNLQNADWLQLSGRLRIAIWNEIARLVLDAPLFGVGADMTYVIRPPLQATPAGAGAWLGFPITHPHNVYLQTWYELGMTGAVLLTAFGLTLLRRIGSLVEPARPFALAMFASAAVQIGFSYSIWQIWFLCLFGFAAAMFSVSLNIFEKQRPTIA